MAGIVETKPIGIPIGTDGSFSNTEFRDGVIQLKTSSDNPLEYHPMGLWTSQIIDIGDSFKEYGKIILDTINTGTSKVDMATRSSVDGVNFSIWQRTADDGSILSPKNKFIQVRLTLYAGATVSEIALLNSEYIENNQFIEDVVSQEGKYITPTLTSNTSSPWGFAFSETNNISYPAWRAFDKSSNTYYATDNVVGGILGFCFSADVYSVSEYSITSSSATVNSMPRDWVLEISKDTTNGLDGNWEIVDSRNAQTWSSTLTTNYYKLQKAVRAKAFRIKWSANNGTTMTRFGELDFFTPAQTALQLKRDYNYDMAVDESWTEIGSLHRKSAIRSEWLRIDRLEVIDSE